MTDAAFGLLGRTLGHSYSPLIHQRLANIEYHLFEREPDEIESFFRSGTWRGVNVTIPYKRDAAALVDELTPVARRLGNVNTVTRQPDGTLLGDNTDYAGFRALVTSLHIDLSNKAALVLGGTGGAGTTCMTVLEDLGAKAVAVSRRGPVTYDDLYAYADAALIVNATPVGMYPACPASPVSLDAFSGLKGVIDIIYNPARTALMMEAERRGIPTVGGLLMLVAQAAAADEHFCGVRPAWDAVRSLTDELFHHEQNIALIGMPGSGKTRVGQEIARMTGRKHVDIDWELEDRMGMSCSDYITSRGEEAFRREETAALRDVAARSRLVISCGGGVVTREENYPLLHQNSRIIMLDRPLQELSSKGRPISARDGVEHLARVRMPLYRAWSDVAVSSGPTPEDTARAAIEALKVSTTQEGSA